MNPNQTVPVFVSGLQRSISLHTVDILSFRLVGSEEISSITNIHVTYALYQPLASNSQIQYVHALLTKKYASFFAIWQYISFAAFLVLISKILHWVIILWVCFFFSFQFSSFLGTIFNIAMYIKSLDLKMTNTSFLSSNVYCNVPLQLNSTYDVSYVLWDRSDE